MKFIIYSVFVLVFLLPTNALAISDGDIKILEGKLEEVNGITKAKIGTWVEKTYSNFGNEEVKSIRIDLDVKKNLVENENFARRILGNLQCVFVDMVEYPNLMIIFKNTTGFIFTYDKKKKYTVPFKELNKDCKS